MYEFLPAFKTPDIDQYATPENIRFSSVHSPSANESQLSARVSQDRGRNEALITAGVIPLLYIVKGDDSGITQPAAPSKRGSQPDSNSSVVLHEPTVTIGAPVQARGDNLGAEKKSATTRRDDQVGAENQQVAFTAQERMAPKEGEVDKGGEQDKVYTFTIYVMEGHGPLGHGHVFMALSNGTTTTTRGFYPKGERPAGALIGKDGGELRDDSAKFWDVKKTFTISKADYEKGLSEIKKTDEKPPDWSGAQHCGDYVYGMTRTVHAPVDLPITATGQARPNVFANWLRNHDAEENPLSQNYHGPKTKATGAHVGDTALHALPNQAQSDK